MSGQGKIVSSVKGQMGVIALDRPEKANAYTREMLDGLEKAFAAHSTDDKVRVIVIQSAVSGWFCSGADLDEVTRRTANDALDLQSTRLFNAIAHSPKPTIAAIDGPAIGGGLELALACDIRIATEKARYALPETALGILPAAGGLFRLPIIAGQSLAREMILFGKTLDAWQALGAGIVSEVVKSEQLEDRVLALVREAAKRDPLALALAKRAMDQVYNQNGAAEISAVSQALLYQNKMQQAKDKKTGKGNGSDGE